MAILVYMDIIVEDHLRRLIPIGRIVIALRNDIVPKTARNFYELCTGDRGFGYKNSEFHRIMPYAMCQGGALNGDGTGNRSIYGGLFEDENFLLKHGVGTVCMVNNGPNENGSQFMISMAKNSYFDGKRVVFGEVVEGMDVVKQIESYGTQNGRPVGRVIIEDCGHLAVV